MVRISKVRLKTLEELMQFKEYFLFVTLVFHVIL